MKYNYAVKSAIGGRKENQDSAGSLQTRLGFVAVVCDGMGGTAGGKTASAMAVDVILHEVRNTQSADAGLALRSAIGKANHEIFYRGRQQPELRGMGTTVVAMIIGDDKVTVAHVGDSRVYQLRDGEKVFRTDDHSKVFELVKRGILTEEQARLSEESNVIQRALGIAPDIDVEINDNLAFWKGDLFVLCTDGVCGALPEEELLKMLVKERDVHKLSKKVIDQIDDIGNRQGGGHDNLTVSLVQPLDNSKLKVRIDMKTRISINILSACVALLVIAVGYIIFSNGTTTPSATLKEIDSLKVQNVRMAKELKEIKSSLDGVSSTERVAEQQSEKPGEEERSARGAGKTKEKDKLESDPVDPTVTNDPTEYENAPDYTIVPGDTQDSIANKLGVEKGMIQKFKDVNKKKIKYPLKAGATIKGMKIPKAS